MTLTKTSRAMVRAAYRSGRAYWPTSHKGFVEMQKLIAKGIFEDSEAYPGRFELTAEGALVAEELDERV